MTRCDSPVLLTGATGFVGMELLARYLERTERPVLTIVRAGSDEDARGRIDAVLANLFGYRAGSYAETNLCPRVAAAGGHIDELISPVQTRSRLSWALRSLAPERGE